VEVNIKVNQAGNLLRRNENSDKLRPVRFMWLPILQSHGLLCASL